MNQELLADQGLLGTLIPVLTGLSVFMFLVFFYRLYKFVDLDERAYMDPLPFKLKLIWPIIQMISFFFCSFLPYGIIENTERRLTTTGVGYLLTAEQFIALRIFSAVFLPLVVLLCMGMLDSYEPIWLVFAPLVGFVLPTIWLSDTRKRREGAVIRTLPVFLDFLTMCIEGGLNFSGALQQAMDKAPPGPLRNEFGIVLRDLRAGVNRADALRRMAERLDIQETTSFVSAVIQAEKMGSSLAAIMRLQADQRRSERFQRAEKLAMEAPIKLVGPLIIFIFPVTFMILGFPIVMKFLAEGLL